MKYACQYAIVRFLPYAETGEFANVGIVLTCPQTGYFDFKLLTRVRRISAFFEELETSIFKNVRKSFTAELTRVRAVLTAARANDDQQLAPTNKALVTHLFAEIVRPREAMIRFDDTRVVLTENPDEKLTELYEHYVERNFATKQYQERLIERHVHQVLRRADLMKIYAAKTLGNNAYQVRFPFVKMENNVATRVIKPLHLAQEDPTQLFDHGWEWLGKIRKLNKEKLLPQAVLFAVNPPSISNTECTGAYMEIMTELKKQNVTVIPYENTSELVKFAIEKT
jgi:ribosomal protein L14